MSELAPSTAGLTRSELAEALLVEMLLRVRHTQDTPLYFGVDGHRVAAAAMAAVQVGIDEDLTTLSDTASVMWELEARVLLALGVNGPPATACEPSDRQSHHGLLAHELGEWMLRAHARMRDVHPLALDMLGMLIEGNGERCVSEELDLGLRLTRRIIADMSDAW